MNRDDAWVMPLELTSRSTPIPGTFGSKLVHKSSQRSFQRELVSKSRTTNPSDSRIRCSSTGRFGCIKCKLSQQHLRVFAQPQT